MANIFISYRRLDSRDAAGRIYDRLVRHFGDDTVFMDVEEALGIDYLENVRKSIHACDVMLVIIGKNWLVDEDGPSKNTRIEVATALARDNLPIIPLLVDSTPMPGREQLPRGIKKLSYRNGIPIASDQSFEGQMQRLIAEITAATGLDSVSKPAVRARTFTNLPNKRSPHFIGREAILERIYAEAGATSGAGGCHVLVGLGGVGKSQMALEFAHRYRDKFSTVWWVDAESERGQLQGLADLAEVLDLPEIEYKDTEKSAHAAVRWLAINHDWLLILDNATTPDAIASSLPPLTHGHALLTSRNPNWSGIDATIIEIPPLDRPDAIQFLLKSTNDQDSDAANQLASELGDLPLALEQARSYMASRAITIANYFQFYQQHGTRLRATQKPATYPHSVATTYSVAIEQIGESDPVAMTLVNCLSLLDPDGVPVSLFTLREKDDSSTDGEHIDRSDAQEESAELACDPFFLTEALATIRELALARVADGTITMHRMVQAVAKDSMSQDDQEQLLRQLISLLNYKIDASIYGTGYSLSSYKGEYDRQIELVSAQAKHFGIENKALAWLSVLVGERLLAQSQYKKAVELLEVGCDMVSRIYGPDTEYALFPQVSLQAAIAFSGVKASIDEAYEAMRPSLETLHQSQPLLAAELYMRCSRNIQELYGNGDLAISFAQRALEIARAQLSESDVQLTAFLQAAAQALHNNKNPEAALPLHEEGIRISIAAKGENDVSLMSNLGCLGDVHKDLGDMDEAVRLRERAFAIAELNFGKGDPRTAEYGMRLSNMYFEAKRESDAIRIGKDMVKLLEAADPGNPKLLGWALIDLSRLEAFQGNLAQAKVLLNKQLRIQEELYGMQSELILDALDGLCNIGQGELQQQRESDEYGPEFENTRKALGETNRALAIRMESIASPDSENGIAWLVRAKFWLAQSYLLHDDFPNAQTECAAARTLLSQLQEEITWLSEWIAFLDIDITLNASRTLTLPRAIELCLETLSRTQNIMKPEDIWIERLNLKLDKLQTFKTEYEDLLSESEKELQALKAKSKLTERDSSNLFEVCCNHIQAAKLLDLQDKLRESRQFVLANCEESPIRKCSGPECEILILGEGIDTCSRCSEAAGRTEQYWESCPIEL